MLHDETPISKHAQLLASFDMPLTEMIRPKSFAEYIGQDHLLNPQNGQISNFLRLGRLPSMVLCGPPGVGKTSLARLLADEANYVFIEYSATSSTVADLKELLGALETENSKRARRHVPRLRVLVFIDEIHRFSTVQQDYLLPFVESGAFVFVGATTVDAQKSVRRAILSRCHLFKLEKLGDQHLEKVVFRAVLHENIRRKLAHKMCFLKYTREAVLEVVKHANGDMRSAVNLVEIISTRLSSAEYAISEQNSEVLVDESMVTSVIKTLSKARFGLNSEKSLPLLSRLLKSLRYPCSASHPNPETSLDSVSGVDASVSDHGKTDSGPNSELESWVDEKDYGDFTGDENTRDWAHHIPFSDDEDAAPGNIYSDDESDPIKVPDLARHSASKFRIVSATHACLQLLNQGESPLAILKYLLLFTCTHSRPEKGELIHVLSVLKAVQKSGIGGEHLLYNVIERLAGTDCYEPQLLRTRMEPAEQYCLANRSEETAVDFEDVEYGVVYDEDLANKLLQDIVEEEPVPQANISIMSLHKLGADFTLGERPGMSRDDFVSQIGKPTLSF